MTRTAKAGALDTARPDYIAIIGFSTGSSFARGSDALDCIERVGKIFVSDWGSLFNVRGREVKAVLFDVTGIGSCYWEGDLVPVDNDTGEKAKFCKVVTVNLPK